MICGTHMEMRVKAMINTSSASMPRTGLQEHNVSGFQFAISNSINPTLFNTALTYSKIHHLLFHFPAYLPAEKTMESNNELHGNELSICVHMVKKGYWSEKKATVSPPKTHFGFPNVFYHDHRFYLFKKVVVQ